MLYKKMCVTIDVLQCVSQTKAFGMAFVCLLA